MFEGISFRGILCRLFGRVKIFVEVFCGVVVLYGFMFGFVENIMGILLFFVVKLSVFLCKIVCLYGL